MMIFASLEEREIDIIIGTYQIVGLRILILICWIIASIASKYQ